MSSKHLVFITGNANKLREVKEILCGPSSAITLDSKNLNVPEVQGTTQEVAFEKCKAAAALNGGPCITEDTALCFEALNGLPGPYIKTFLDRIGLDGLVKLVQGFDTNKAYALCTFAYCEGPGHDPIIFEGRTDGHIVPKRGDNRFGWDPIFEVDGHGKTFAEMLPVEKNEISHRSRALKKLKEHLESLSGTSN